MNKRTKDIPCYPRQTREIVDQFREYRPIITVTRPSVPMFTVISYIRFHDRKHPKPWARSRLRRFYPSLSSSKLQSFQSENRSQRFELFLSQAENRF